MRARITAFSLALVVSLVGTSAWANDIAFFQTIFGTDFVSAGAGGMRNTAGPHPITIAGVTGPVTKAYLYWHGPTDSTNPLANATILLNGNPVVGTNIGFSNDNCWGFGNSQGYRTDVTSLVTGDGAYSISGHGIAPAGTGGANTNGASLVVFFNDGNATNNRDAVIFDGNDSNIPNSFDANGWNVTLAGINYMTGMANMQLHVADGQTFTDDALVVNSTTLVPTGAIFQGVSVPGVNNGPTGNGNLWDIKSFDVTTFLSPGPNTLTLTTGVAGDCLALVVAIVDLPPGAAPADEQITLDPATASNCTTTSHTVTATVLDNTTPVVGTTVTFTVVSGPNAGATGSSATDSSGMTTFTYLGLSPGIDTIEACFVDSDGVKKCATVAKEWVVCNLPPDTGQAKASESCLWPPNHMFVPIMVEGVTDPDGDPVIIVVTGVTSDEPTATMLGAGGGAHAPDAKGVGSSTAHVRSERSGTSDGRVYEIHFVADDGRGGRTRGMVKVEVPHDVRGKSCSAVDSGQLYDATN